LAGAYRSEGVGTKERSVAIDSNISIIYKYIILIYVMENDANTIFSVPPLHLPPGPEGRG
jgi:hypothetical protein